MKKSITLLIALLAAGGGYFLYNRSNVPAAAANAPAAGGRGGQGGGGGFGGGFPGQPGGQGIRLPMTVELATVVRGEMSEQITVVGNLIGAATIEATPKVNGRLEEVYVRMGDRVSRGQRIAKIEDHEILEQLKQAEASSDVSSATIRQRDADLKFAQTNLDRSRNLFDRQLIPKQTMDDAEARYQAAAAQLDLAKAQYAQAQARLDELKINLGNTLLTSPVNGFIGKRLLDPGAWVTPNSAFISVVDIGVVRMVANVIEKDLRRVSAGQPAEVGVDAFPNEQFGGRIARVSPVLDPATRTAQIEVEINNAQFRLKPGMYAKVNFTVERRPNALIVPANAVVDYEGKKGVFMPGGEGDQAHFQPIQSGLISQTQIEITSGVAEGDQVVTTGAGALREGDRMLLPGQNADARGGRGGRGRSGEGSPAGGGQTRGGQRRGQG
ncbi:MAG: efflux RND transporter periplasmic adaptor subunit [Acidobacteriota bacterium]